MNSLESKEPPLHASQKLKSDLAGMGIKKTDVLLVHSSLKSIGKVEGGADTVLDALMDALSDGLLVFPTLSYESVNANQPFFSVLNTPGCVGILPELFRKRKGVYRSWHPTHSLAAWGRGAEDFVSGHEKFDTPCARESPWGKLVQRKAKILFVGTGLACNTLLHGVEEWFGVPERLSDEKEALKVETPEGLILEVPSRRHLGHPSDHYAKLEGIFDRSGILKTGVLGSARCHLLEAAPMAELTLKLLQKDTFLFSHSGVPDSN